MDKDMQVDSEAEADTASSGFVFSRPNIVYSPERPANFGVLSDNVFGSNAAQPTETSMFTFAAPDTIAKEDHMEDADILSDNTIPSKVFTSPFSSKSTKEISIFNRGVKSNEDQKSPFRVENVQTNVFSTSVKPSDDLKPPFATHNSEKTSIFAKSVQSNEDKKSIFGVQDTQANIFSAAAKTGENFTSPFGAYNSEKTSIFARNVKSQGDQKSSSETHNSEQTNVFAKSFKSNEDQKSPLAVEDLQTNVFSAKPSGKFESPLSPRNAEKTSTFTRSSKSNEDYHSPFAVKDVPANIFSTKPNEDFKSPFGADSSEKTNVFTKSVKTDEDQIAKGSKSQNDTESSLPVPDARAKLSRRSSKSSEDLKSAQAVKNSEVFSRLESNKKKTADVKLELSRSITCSEVPDSLLLKNEAKNYFEQFGETLKITIRPKRKMITVYYATDKGALKAYSKAESYDGQDFKTDWTTPEMLTTKPRKKESIKGKIANFLDLDEDVKEELKALTGLEYNVPELESVKAITAKAKLKKSRELTSKSLAQKRVTPLITKSLVKAAKTMATKPVEVKRVLKIPKKEESIPRVEVPVENKALKKVSSAAIEEMQNLIRQPGTTAEEKYKILDARDRLMRLKMNKQKSLESKVTKGTCPDMCPEKERYMREFQRQVFSYEQQRDSDEYRIDHSLAVKQYSRSSADQEEPMPHELRPVKSLKLTMNYLLHEIVELCEEDGTNLAEWYHFLWDRMRSIRKDITQQELCCLDTVELVEQCARFHILASERLCAEGTTIFDPKINSENLTKCLQSLKYMYDDLRENGIACPNEAEFRAYVILLNLNNGTFISELRTVPPNIQHSPQVKFALDVHSSMDMNNYSRFFKLVRKTTYLNACILLRYFNQVRVKAISTMVKAYCRTNVTEYPLYELIDILGFEDEEEVLAFCHRVGLKCDAETLYIKLKKESFHEPDTNLEQRRACNLVLSKRLSCNQTVGECIAGGAWSEKLYENYKPHSSFDSQGYLMRSAVNAQDQNLEDPYEFKVDDDMEFVSEEKKVVNNVEEKKTVNALKPATTPFTFKKPVQPTTPSTPVVKKPVPTTTKDTPVVAKTTASSIFTPMSNTTSPSSSSIFGKLTQPQPSVFSTFKPTTTLPTTSPISMAVNKSIFSGASGPQTNLFKQPSMPLPPPVSLPQQPKRVEVPSTKERMALKRPMEDTTDGSGMEKKLLTEKQELLKKQLETEQRLKAEKEKMKIMEEITAKSIKEYNRLEGEVTEEVCSTIVRTEIERIEMIDNLSRRMYDRMLEELCANILNEQLFVHDMLIEVERRLRDRLLLKYCRAWKQWAARRRAQRREALDNTPVWLQPESIEECARKLYNPQQKIAIQYARENRRKISLEEEQPQIKHAPIEFIVNVGLKENAKSFDVEASQHSFWKMVVSWPLLENRLTIWRHKKTVNKYLSPSDFTQEPIFIEHKPSPHERLDICIRYFEGLICGNCLTGMDALLFVIFGDEDERSIEHRLTKTVLGRGKLPPIPLVIIVFGDEEVDPSGIKVASVLDTVLESGHVSEYTIIRERSTDENVVLRVFQSATLWLAINRSPAVPLEMDYLKRVFDDCLTEELWLRIQGHLSHDHRFSVPLNDPNFIINLHNEAVNYLTDIIMDNESMSYTDFAPELKIFLDNKRPYPCTYEYFDAIWKQSEYRAELLNVMSNFIFPPWTDEWPIHDMMELHDAIVNYCHKLLSYEISLAITSNIMSDLFLIAGYNEDSVPIFSDILLHIMGKKISDIPGNTRVVYNKNHVKHFQTLPWWFKSNALVDYMANCKANQSDASDNPMIQEITASTSQLDLDFECDIDELNETCMQKEEEVPVSVICEEARHQISEVQSVVELLDKQLDEQRLKNEDFEARLKAALEDDFFSNAS